MIRLYEAGKTGRPEPNGQNAASSEAAAAKIAQLERTILKQQATLVRYQKTLSAIYESNGYRLLDKYYGYRNYLLPPGSRRRSLAQTCLHTTTTLVRNLWKLIRNRGVPVPDASSSGNTGEAYKDRFTILYRSLLRAFMDSGSKLVLPTASDRPRVSILLVLHNRAELTLMCLRSILETVDVPYEVIIIDNGSTDSTYDLLDRVEGARITYNSENLNFLLGCQQAARQAQGEYLLFLNNDAQLQPGTLASALKTIESAPDIGAVGGKVILLNGCLQEAGSIVWRDGSCLGYGRGDDPSAPPYNFQRDVDYCSGVFLLTRRDLFLDNGGFDEDFKPAYYEETDYCLRLWRMGQRVVYDPGSVVLHFEFASSKSSDRAIQLQSAHREILVEKHRARLQEHELPDLANVLRARTTQRQGPRILWIEDQAPRAQLGSGFPRTEAILNVLLEQRCQITFYPIAGFMEAPAEAYRHAPRTIEIMLGLGAVGLEEFLRQRKDHYDLILISRPHNMQVFRSILERHPEWFTRTRVVYDAEALFSLREVALRQLQGESVPVAEVQALVREEVALATGTHAVISVSEAENEHFRRSGCTRVFTLGHTLPAAPTETPFEERQHFLFVGAIRDDNSPNADSVFWFVRDIWPQLLPRLGWARFLIAGLNESERITDLACDTIDVLGSVDDLTPLYARCRVFVAPTRYGAGIPLKVYHAAAHGLPIVATALVAKQLDWQDDIDLLVADDPAMFAEQCHRLSTDPQLWSRLRANALRRIREECSQEAFASRLKEILQLAKSA